MVLLDTSATGEENVLEGKSADEMNDLMKYVGTYIRAVKDYLGYIQVKALTPNAMASFRLLVESHFLEFAYKESCEPVTNRFNKTFVLEDASYQSIREHFIDRKCYLVMVGTNDFAESFVTAEWLRNSMGKAGAIDLTAIGLGYFKAVEQLMYALICLHKNEGKTIKAAGSKDRIPLNDANIRANEIDTSLGSMAKLYKDYLRMCRCDIDYRAKCYIREALFGYADLRNGYLHKDNIHDMARIDEIRTSSIRLIFLLLGAHELDEVSQEQLGMPASQSLTTITECANTSTTIPQSYTWSKSMEATSFGGGAFLTPILTSLMGDMSFTQVST